jgi:hypothetical protein
VPSDIASLTALAEPSTLATRSVEELKELRWQGEKLEYAASLLKGAVAAEFRRRYGRYGEGWYLQAARVLKARPGLVYLYCNLWDAFHTRLEDWERLGGRVANACSMAEDPEAAIDYAVKEREKGRPVASVVLDIKRLFGKSAARRGFAYGAPLNLPYLRHEPIDEQGVVFLFGAVAGQLGFLVEAVRQRFPDCRAKREVGGVYQDVTIEFEFRSSDFHRHGHATENCDLIVCWQHDWVDCPIEVLELKSRIQELTTSQ